MNTRSIFASTVSVGAAVIAFAMAVPVPATAASPQRVARDGGDTWTQRVAYRDLDLRDEAGRKALEQRVRSAARQVCNYAHAAEVFAELQCRRTAMRIARPELQALYRAADTTQLASNDRR